MGKGDMKTKKGKVNRGTFGASRPRKSANKIALQKKYEIKKK
ncbi:30S ribosomal protein THX [Algoriphagus machipongonensis]|nr:30S ribosomal protein THX [Algoriphagus machipongonensis]